MSRRPVSPPPIYPIADQIIRSTPYRLDQERQRRAGVKHEAPFQGQVLFDLLVTYQEAKCIDSRDKVFGLHSLAMPCCQVATPIDYSKSAFSVCGELLQHYFLRHHWHLDSFDGASTDVIQKSQFANRLLCGATSSEAGRLTQAAENLPRYDSEDLKLIHARGNIRGEICHATINLDNLSESDLYWNFPSKYKIRLSNALMDHMDYISRSATSLRPLSMLHVVCKTHNQRTFAKSVSDVETQAPTQLEEWSIYKNYWLSKRRQIKNVDECFADIVHKAKEHVQSSQPETGCKLFFEANGMMGFAPEEAQEGDMMCQFRNSHVIAIVRRVAATSYKIIGRAVEFLADGGPPQPCRWGREDPGNSGFDVPAHSIDLYVDIHTLQLLAKVEAGGRDAPKAWSLTAADKAKSW